MRKLIYTITALVAFVITTNAQVAIEIDNEANISNKAILDFPENADGAILLPYVQDSATAGTEGGTIIYSAQDGIVYVNNGTEWIPFSDEPNDAASIASHDLTTDRIELDSDGVLISDAGEEEQAQGVLVLKSNERALQLPQVAGVENLQSPKSGMICFDTTRNSLAIYNGEVWVLRN